MSKYKIGFRVQIGRHKETEVLDLIDDYGYTEEDAKSIIEDNDRQYELFRNWINDNVDQEFWVVDIE